MNTKLIVAALAVGAGLSVPLMAAPAAQANPIPPQCQLVPWGFLGGQQRAICDGPIRKDGSWERARVISVPAHQVPVTSTLNCFGTGYTVCNGNQYGGYFQPYTELSSEVYIVTPDTVLPDEPGHLG